MGHSNECYPYICELASSGEHIYAPADSDSCIRLFVANAFERVVQAIKCNDSLEQINFMLDDFGIDLDMVRGKLIFPSAEAGHISMIGEILDINEHCGMVDPKGRNILHILLANGHVKNCLNHGHANQDIIATMVKFLMHRSDFEGQSCLHLLVLLDACESIDICASEYHIQNVARTTQDDDYVEVHHESVTALSTLSHNNSVFQPMFYWPNNDGLNARELAARLGKTSVVSFMDKLEVDLFCAKVFSTCDCFHSLVREWFLKMAPEPMQSLNLFSKYYKMLMTMHLAF
jgi:hypothetical protein